MKKFIIKVSSFLVMSGYAPLAWAQQTAAYPRSHMMWSEGWLGWFIGPLMMIAFLAIAVAVVVLIVRAISGSTSQGVTSQIHSIRSPLDILKTRYAKGEMDKEEYEERRQTLEE